MTIGAYCRLFKPNIIGVSLDFDIFIVFSVMGFRENLKAQLTYADMQINTLAALSGVKPKTIASYLGSHSRSPSVEAAVGIAQALGVSVEYLVTGKDLANDEVHTAISQDIRLMLQISRRLGKKDRGTVLNLMKYLRDNQTVGTDK